MPSPVQRFEAWMNAWIEWARKQWGEPLYKFLLGSSYETIGEMSRVTREGADLLEKSLRDQLKPLLERLKATEGLPDDIKAILDKATEEPGWIHLAALMPYLIGMLMGVGMSSAMPLGNIGSYTLDNLVRSARIDPISVITAWRRDPVTYEKLFKDLKDQGWDEDRIEALKFYSQAYPALADVIRFYAREAFEPDMIAKYGLDEETPPYEGTLFEKLGVPKEIADLYWISHWVHATFIQMREMLHRGLLTGAKEVPTEPVGYEGWASRDAEGEAEMYQWYRVVEIPPIWRALLTASLWNVPTRVDVRRFWDMRTITEEDLISIYHRQGYHGEDLKKYVLWTKVYVAFPDLMARWTKGWITEDDVRTELTGLGMPYDRVTEMIQTKKKAVDAGKVEEGKALTKSEIYKGVKKGTLTREEALDLLMDLNYTLTQAEYLLDINVAALEGSPETYEEFKDITTKYRIAIGKEEKPMPEELKKAAEEVVRLTKEVESLKEAIETEERGLVEEEVLPEAATAKRDELRVTLHRAEAELARVKTEYDTLVAEWRHGK